MEYKRGNIIVSADDFGLSEKANLSILELSNLGKIHRVAIFADGEFKKEQLDQLASASVRLDIHLDLPRKILTPEGKANKHLSRMYDFLRFYFAGQNGRKLVENEWLRQMRKFKEIFGRAPDGITSHQHVHFFPAYLPIAIELAKMSNDRYLRFFKKNPPQLFGLVSVAIFVLGRLGRRAFVRAGLCSADYLLGLDWIDSCENIQKLSARGSVELMVHPERDAEMKMIKELF
jgi:predicted glycoside hydrolase/deacetylase ChbG (UPF0249 family)